MTPGPESAQGSLGPTAFEPVAVRPERAGDEAAVRAICAAAFETDAEARLLDALRACGAYDRGLSLVAVVPDPAQPGGEAIVGQVLLTRVDVEPASEDDRLVGPPDAGRDRPLDPAVLALGPIAVLPDRQRRGIGAALVRAALVLAVERGAWAVVLLGHPAYYPRFGFEPARPLGLLPSADWPDAAWMACRLPGWSPSVAGVVGYARPFLEMGE